MVRRATIVALPTVTANWLTCSSPGSWRGGCKASPTGEQSVYPLGFWAPWKRRVDWRKVWRLAMQKWNGLRQGSLTALCRKKISPVCGTRRLKTLIVFTTTGQRSLVAWHSWIYSIFLWCLSKTSCIHADNCGMWVEAEETEGAELQLQSPIEKLMHTQLL